MGKRGVFRPDPRTDLIASRLMADAMEDVARRMVAGQDHYSARDAVLRELAPAWSSVAGKPAADAAVRGLHHLDPTEYMDENEHGTWQRAEEAREAAWVARLAVIDGPRPVPASWWPGATRAATLLLLILGSVVAFVTHARAETSEDRFRALAVCGRATLGSAEYERRCRRFGGTERATVRDYDGPGAGAARSWEWPKDWE